MVRGQTIDTHTLWLLALSLATPVAGIVGFALQLRQVKKTRLENEKLQLEIDALRKGVAGAETRIVHATNEEVKRISWRDEPQFSRKGPPGSEYANQSGKTGEQRKTRYKDRIFEFAIVTAVVVVLGYLAYDIYRIIMWLKNALSL